MAVEQLVHRQSTRLPQQPVSTAHMEQHTTSARSDVAAAVCSGGDTAEAALLRHLAEHARSLGFTHSSIMSAAITHGGGR